MCDTKVPPEIQDIIKTIVKNERIESYDFQIEGGNQKGEGFLGDVLFFTITDKSTKKAHQVVLKRSLENEIVREKYSIRRAYLTEINFYNNIWVQINKFLHEKAFEKPVINIAKCYASSTEENKEYIALHNLKTKGFIVFDKKKHLQPKHFEYIFETFGKLHGVGFAFKKQHPEEFSKFSSNFMVKVIQGFEQNFKFVLNTLKDIFVPGKDDDVLQSFENYFENGYNIMLETVKLEGNFSTLLHGDCWNNNMMFKFDNEENMTDLALIDFQAVTTNSPVFDLSYCLYSGATNETLDIFDKLLSIYYESLSSTIRSCGENPNELYTLENLKEDWRKYARFGMIFSFLIWRLRCKKQEDTMDLTELEDKEKLKKALTCVINPKFNIIVRDIVKHMYNLNAL